VHDVDEDIVGIAEVGQILGLSRQRTDILSRAKGFPEPIATLTGGRIWRRADIEAWAKATGRGLP
jgi:predicted DNA-binding transcriptional regulator AlpA